MNTRRLLLSLNELLVLVHETIKCGTVLEASAIFIRGAQKVWLFFKGNVIPVMGRELLPHAPR